MKSARLDHAATCLADGRVLVCGGKNGGAIASAEVYDRQISAFLPTGSMTTRRQLHTATLLPRGVVLVTGGWDGQRSLASAEVYDPASGRFYRIGAMFSPRESHTATLLRDGTVLFAGGDNDGRPSDTAEVSDPEGTFRRIGPMRTARTGHTATLLPDGTVLVVGGEDIDGNAINSAECFDPRTGKFRPASAMRLPARGMRQHSHPTASSWSLAEPTTLECSLQQKPTTRLPASSRTWVGS